MAVLMMEGFETEQWAARTVDFTLTAVGGINPQIISALDYGSLMSVRKNNSALAGNTLARCVVTTRRLTGYNAFAAVGFKMNLLAAAAARTALFASILDASGAGIATFGVNRGASPMVVTIDGQAADSGAVIELGVDYFVDVEIDTVAMVTRLWISNQLVATTAIQGSPDLSAISFICGYDSQPNALNGSVAANAELMRVDDVYCVNGVGPLNTTRLGRVKVIERSPVSDEVTDFQRSAGASNAAAVADKGAPSTDSTYVYSNQAGAVDLYGNSTPLPVEGEVVAMGVTLAAKKAGADARAVSPLIQSGGADLNGNLISLTVNSVTVGTTVFNSDPATGQEWTRESALAARFGQILAV